MKIEDILRKQGEIYKNLTSNKTIEECNETIEKPKPVKLVPYRNYEIPKQEYKAIKGLEKLLNKEPIIVDKPKYNSFEILIDDNQIIYLRIANLDLTNIPKEISFLPNLQKLNIRENKITKLENLDKLTNLQELYLDNNKISKLENLDNLPNLRELWLESNQITKIENLDNLTNLQELYLNNNKISKLENLDKLTNLQELYLDNNKITKLENLDNLPNLQELWLQDNPIKNKKEEKKLRKKGIDVII